MASDYLKERMSLPLDSAVILKGQAMDVNDIAFLNDKQPAAIESVAPKHAASVPVVLKTAAPVASKKSDIEDTVVPVSPATMKPADNEKTKISVSHASTTPVSVSHTIMAPIASQTGVVKVASLVNATTASTEAHSIDIPATATTANADDAESEADDAESESSDEE